MNQLILRSTVQLDEDSCAFRINLKVVQPVQYCGLFRSAIEEPAHQLCSVTIVKKYSDFRTLLRKLQRHHIVVDAEFPRRFKRAFFGIEIGQENLNSRCDALDKWTECLLGSFSLYQKPPQEETLKFFGFSPDILSDTNLFTDQEDLEDTQGSSAILITRLLLQGHVQMRQASMSSSSTGGSDLSFTSFSKGYMEDGH